MVPLILSPGARKLRTSFDFCCFMTCSSSDVGRILGFADMGKNPNLALCRWCPVVELANVALDSQLDQPIPHRILHDVVRRQHDGIAFSIELDRQASVGK